MSHKSTAQGIPYRVKPRFKRSPWFFCAAGLFDRVQPGYLIAVSWGPDLRKAARYNASKFGFDEVVVVDAAMVYGLHNICPGIIPSSVC